jgi:hypothetical protein
MAIVPLHPLNFWPDADKVMTALAARADEDGPYRAVTGVLRRLAADPFSRRLHTALLMSPRLGGVCATPAGVDDWYVFWQRSLADKRTVEILLVHQLPIGRPERLSA